jgi:hypothetical protein
MIYSG